METKDPPNPRNGGLSYSSITRDTGLQTDVRDI